MVQRIRKAMNGHGKTVVGGGLLAVLGTGWLVYAQKQIEVVPIHTEWIKGHEQWTATTLAGTLDKIKTGDEHLSEKIEDKAENIERQLVIQTETAGEWRKANDKSLDRIITVLDRLDKKLDDVKDRLPPKGN